MITEKTTYIVEERREVYLPGDDQVAADRDVVQNEIRRLCPVARCDFSLDLNETAAGCELVFSCPAIEFTNRTDAELALSGCRRMHIAAKDMVDGMAEINAGRGC